MKKKTVIALLVVVLLGIIFGALYFNKDVIDQVILIKIAEKRYARVLLDNQEDFEYAAKAMQQLDVTYISFENGNYSYDRKKFRDKIANNEELKYHLTQLSAIEGIESILLSSDGSVRVILKGKGSLQCCLCYSDEETKHANHDYIINNEWSLYLFLSIL